MQQVADGEADQRAEIIDQLFGEQPLCWHQATQDGEKVKLHVTDALASELGEQYYQSVHRRVVIDPVFATLDDAENVHLDPETVPGGEGQLYVRVGEPVARCCT